jgi:ribose/xylose/arabinose/galactoside ABC-type transport system permease subunit
MVNNVPNNYDFNNQIHGKKNLLKSLIRFKQFGLVILLVLVFSLLAWKSPVFLSTRNISVLLSQISMMAITAVGMTILLASGEVDLSVGSQQAFIGVLTMQALNLTNNLWVGIIIGISLGLLIGFINSVLVNELRVVSFIITLAMMFILRGLSYSTTRAAVQNLHKLEGFYNIGNGFLWIIPIPIIIMTIVFVIFYLLFNHTVFGGQVFAVGGNEQAASICGIRVKKIKTIGFLIVGALSSLSAIILISRMNSGQNNAGFGFEMQVIAATLLGGCTLGGGEGNLIGTMLAVLLIGVVGNGVVLLNLDSSWSMVFVGILILLSVIIDSQRKMLEREVK